MVIRANDLLTWLDDSIVWQWGLRANGGCDANIIDRPIKTESLNDDTTATSTNDDYQTIVMRSLKHSQVDFTEVEAEKGEWTNQPYAQRKCFRKLFITMLFVIFICSGQYGHQCNGGQLLTVLSIPGASETHGKC